MVYYAQYATGDLSSMIIDIIGGVFNALASQIGTIAVLIVIVFILVLVADALTGVFGIFKKLKR